MFTRSFLIFSLFAVTAASHAAEKWGLPEWTVRKKIVIDTTAEGGAINDPIGSAAVLIRLHEGNFNFLAGKEDGSDIRFTSEDGKTQYPYHLEKFDSLMNEAFAWVKIPDLKPGAKTTVWLYYGNSGPKATKVEDAKATYDGDTELVYHLAERGAPAADASGQGNSAETTGVPAEGALIGGGLRLNGRTPIIIPAKPSLEWSAGQSLTWSAWVKPAVLQPNAILFQRGDATNAFVIGLNNDIPFVEVTNGGAAQQTAPGSPIPSGSWTHLAVVADGSKLTLYVNGDAAGTLNAALPALTGPLAIGGDPNNPGAVGVAGEVDELNIARAARPAGAIKFAALTQGGTPATDKLLQFGNDEESGGHSEVLEHLSLFGDIAKNMMFDGWVVIFFCCIMVVVSWTVAIRKFLYLNKIKKGTAEFMRQWKQVSSDLTALDHADPQSVKSLGGADEETQELMHESPLYQIYHIGSEEIGNRLRRKGTFQGLSARSIQAIKASLDSGLVREVHRLNNGLIFLTISIAGGPYVGLLGTVMGVMITFAVIAKHGEVDVNSIAPGIASALLATVAGLVVAIPALFIYSYLNSRIKDAISDMNIFIDEFIAKMAEFYPPPGESGVPIQKIDLENENA